MTFWDSRPKLSPHSANRAAIPTPTPQPAESIRRLTAETR